MKRIGTRLAQLDHYLDPLTGGLSPPIQPATTFARARTYAPTSADHIYARDDNTLYRIAEALLADLDGGAGALVFPSGMAAIASLFRTLRPGQTVALQHSLYYGTLVWVQGFCARHGLQLKTFDAADIAALKAAARGSVDLALVWIETPSNPLLHVVGIETCAAIAHEAGAALAVDGTTATPVLSRPLDLGADLVMHSASKFLNGHSDVLAGLLVTKVEDERWDAIRADRHDAGAVLGSFETWLLLRGLRTLELRVRRASATALDIATFLEGHPAIERVHYPGLASHPSHGLAKRQMQGGFGGLLAFQVRGDAQRALEVAGRLEVIVRATSLGGVESVIEHRHTIEGTVTGVPETLLRLSVGIEDPADLITDLEQALG